MGEAKTKVLPTLVLVAVAGTNCLIYGIVFGFSSPSGAELMADNKLDTEQNAYYGSLPILGTVLGSLIAAYTAEGWGRKVSLLIISIPSCLGLGLVLLALQAGWSGRLLIGLLYTGRFLQGVAGGITLVVYPAYVAECVTKEMRGLFSSSLQLLWEFGIVLVYVLGIPMPGKWLALVPFLMSVLCAALSFRLPESPPWLLKHNKKEQAREALVWLRGANYDIDGEIEEKEEAMKADEGQSNQLTLQDFKDKTFYKPLLIGLSLAVIQLASGIAVVIAFSINIIQQTGFNYNPALISVMTAGILFVFTFIPAALADRLGRRPFLLLSTTMNTICLFLLGLYFYLTEVHQKEGLVAMSLTAILVFFAAYSIGLGPIVYVTLGEIFPLRARGAGIGLAIVLAFIIGFVMTKEFPAMSASLHNYGTFWLYACVNLIGAVFIGLFVPETKGKSLEEIEEYFRGT